MRYLILLLFIPFVSYGQNQTTVVGVKTTTQIVNEREIVLSEPSTNIRVPLTADLGNYTQIALVNVELVPWNQHGGLANPIRIKRHSYELVAEALSFSSFEVLNPIEVDKKKWKKDNAFLNKIKNEDCLYLSLRQQEGRGDDMNISVNVRNSKNKTIYSSTSVNVGLNETLAVLSDF